MTKTFQIELDASMAQAIEGMAKAQGILVADLIEQVVEDEIEDKYLSQLAHMRSNADHAHVGHCSAWGNK